MTVPTLYTEPCLSLRPHAPHFVMAIDERVRYDCPGVPEPPPHRCPSGLADCTSHPKWSVTSSTTYPGMWEVYAPGAVEPAARRPVWEAAVDLAIVGHIMRGIPLPFLILGGDCRG